MTPFGPLGSVTKKSEDCQNQGLASTRNGLQGVDGDTSQNAGVSYEVGRGYRGNESPLLYNVWKFTTEQRYLKFSFQMLHTFHDLLVFSLFFIFGCTAPLAFL